MTSHLAYFIVHHNVDLILDPFERCVAWLLSDQLFKGKHADLDISADIQKMSEVESHGFCRSDVERAVLAHGGDVDTACRALQNGTFTVSAMSA